MPSLRHLLVIAFASLLLAGCPKAARKGPGLFAPNAFPKKEKLEALGAQPAPTPIAQSFADVESWTLVAPLPTAYGPAPRVPIGPMEAAFADAVAPHASLRFTEPMACAARQLAKFQIVNDARPAEDLERFIVTRCGSPAISLRSFLSTFTEVRDEVTEEQLATSAKESMARAAEDFATEGEVDVGVGFAREKGRVILVWTGVTRPVDLDLLSMAAKDGKVVVTGTRRTAEGLLLASVTRGRFDTNRCVVDESVAAPRFSLTCEIDPKDPTAWIDVAVLPPERLLSHGIADILVAPGGGLLPDTYRRPELPGVAAPTASTAPLAEGFLDAINQVRVEAGLPRVRAVDTQNAQADRVAPHFFAASFRLVPETVADVVALGLMAGWQVDAVVHNSVLTSAWTGQSRDPRRLVASMLAQPGGRGVLLDKDADVVSIGTVSHPEQRFLGAVVTSYRLYEYVSPEQRAERVMAQITRIRAKKGLGPVRVIPNLAPEIDKTIARIETQHYQARPALQSLLADVTQKAKRGTQGFVFETRDLDDFEIPDDIAESAEIPIQIAVAYHRPEGEAWGRWVIFVVTFQAEEA